MILKIARRRKLPARRGLPASGARRRGARQPSESDFQACRASCISVHEVYQVIADTWNLSMIPWHNCNGPPPRGRVPPSASIRPESIKEG
eukprot:608549-Hanusia_phi.AAC.1